MITLNIFSALNVAPFSFASSAIALGLMTKPTKIQVKNATIGINTLLLMKSMISSTDIPIQLMKLSGPNPREDGIPTISENTNTRMQERLRGQCNLSMMKDTMVSINEMDEVSAANNTNKKNNVPMTPPKRILSNTFGSVINISPGPAPKAALSPPENANTAGMIIRPARKATKVSKNSI